MYMSYKLVQYKYTDIDIGEKLLLPQHVPKINLCVAKLEL